MKSIRSFLLVKSLLFGLLAAGLSPRLATAQASVEGKFTLPFEARWGNALLQPGDYSFSIQSTDLPARVVIRREPRGGQIAMVLARGWDSSSSSDQSALTVAHRGGKVSISSLYLGKLGLTFYYSIPQPKKELLARGPELARHVPVSGPAK